MADIGCDHGILSIALAISGRYEGVVGVDVSRRALEDGAMVSYRRMRVVLEASDYDGGGGDDDSDSSGGGGCEESITEEKQKDDHDESFLKSILPVSFQVGDGLECLSTGEADIVCIAGMGVNTMLSILLHRADGQVSAQQQPTKDEGGDGDDENDGGEKMIPIDTVQCQRLLLQPTNSRPRNLMKLYGQLAQSGFVLTDERVAYLNSRWYVTCAFDRIDDNDDDDHRKATEFNFPGTILAARGDEEFQRYVDHHSAWLEGDLRRNNNATTTLDGDDVRWLERIRCEM